MSKSGKKKKDHGGYEDGIRVVATNRKARHLYHIDETYEAGLVLRGTEVKSLRQGGCSIIDTYADVHGGEAWLINFHINPYEQGNRWNVDAKRTRKLLLTGRELRNLAGLVSQKGYTLIPLRVYFKGSYAKVLLGLCRGKKEFDKRQDIRERDAKRDMDRAMKIH